MNLKNEIIPVKITVLSPLHIGSGKTADTEVETIRKNEETIAFLSLDKLLEGVVKNKQQFYELSRKIAGETNKPLEKIISEKTLEDAIIYMVHDERTSRFSRDIKTFVRDARNIPLIPGTSLKGAIRTLIFKAYLKEHEELLNPKNFNDKRYSPESKVFGRDAQKDPMKILKTRDIYPENENISLRTVKMFDISNDGSRCGFKKTGRGGGELTEANRATPINVEALNEGTVLNGQIVIDRYFYKNTLGDKGSKDIDKEWFKDFFEDFFSSLAITSKYETLKDVDDEIDFLEKFGADCNVQKVIQFYKDLKKDIKNSNGTIYLRMAWGIGWKGMTGNVYKGSAFDKIVANNKLDKRRRAVVFPKTRRLFMERNKYEELAAYPAGWIKIEKE